MISADGYHRLYDAFHPIEWAEKVIEPTLGITLDQWQRDFLSDENTRIVLNCHRQSGKSLACAIKAVHTTILPNKTVVVISPTQRQSSLLHHTIRHLLKDIGIVPSIDNTTSTELQNGSRIISLPGSQWTIRGYTADVVIVDEAAGVDDEVFAAVSPMLLTTNGTMIILSTPQGQQGVFWDAYNDPEHWHLHEIKVQDNPRMRTPDKIEMLEGEKRALGSRLFSQEYECQFLGEMEGGMFKKEWVRYTDERCPPNALRVRYWDCAITSQKKADEQGTDPDWTVGTLIASYDGRIVVEDVVRARVGPLEKQNLIKNTAHMDGYDTSIVYEIEGGSSGTEVYDMYSRLLAGYSLRGDHPTGPKIVRCQAFAAAMERGDIEIIRADWNKDWIQELVAFPLGLHDDQCDSVGGAYRFLTEGAEQNLWFF